MNFKHSTTSMAIAIMAVSLISMTSIQQDVFAQNQGMAITATANSGSDIITVSGKTTSHLTDITFTVVSPSGLTVVVVDQVSPDNNGNFAAEFKIGPTWTENGFYTITAMQGIQQNSLYTLEVLVEVTNKMARETFVTESNLETGLFVSNEPNVAKDAGLKINANFVEGSTIIEIVGSTDRVSQDITITVTAPNKENKVHVDQVTPNLDGEFVSIITTGGKLWKQDGIYTVTAQQFEDPKYTVSTEVGIKDGVVVPEFGTIAAMILAVAIISIIAVSAKSRLSIIPRY